MGGLLLKLQNFKKVKLIFRHPVLVTFEKKNLIIYFWATVELSTHTDTMKFRLEAKLFIYSIYSTVYETEIFVYDLEKKMIIPCKIDFFKYNVTE